MALAGLFVFAIIAIILGLVFNFLFSNKRNSYPLETPTNDLLRVKVTRVCDGDTVVASDSGRDITVRLSAIDCPEDGQEWGNIAKAGLIKLIGQREVYLETYGIDSYGRTLATIYVMQGSELMNVNERMVMLGHAWVMRLYYGHLSKTRQRQLNRLERWAKSKKVGLWSTENPIPPWQWRKED